MGEQICCIIFMVFENKNHPTSVEFASFFPVKKYLSIIVWLEDDLEENVAFAALTRKGMGNKMGHAYYSKTWIWQLGSVLVAFV